jgi:hypothetical protein
MQATVTQATTITPATSNIKDDSNIIRLTTAGMKATTGTSTQYGQYERHQKQRCLQKQ